MCDEKKKKSEIAFYIFTFSAERGETKIFFQASLYIYIFLTKYFMNELYILVILEENNF